MKRSFAAFLFISMVWTGALAAKGPQVDLIDNKLSISAENTSLGRLLQLVDLATGMKSKVPPELANRNISVRFSGLNVSDAVRKMFQGQPLDYVVIQGQGIIVTAASQTTASSGDTLPAAYNPAPPPQAFEQPFIQDFPQNPALGFQQQQQPPMVQTPFGPIANPRAQQAQPSVPVTIPGQQNSLFPQPGQTFNNGQQTPVQILPGNQGNPNPFGTPSPFGTPNTLPANQNNSLFGSSPIFSTPGAQPR